ncbi:MAG: PHA/PHB synthase family protein [Novosphingobium sp.]
MADSPNGVDLFKQVLKFQSDALDAVLAPMTDAHATDWTRVSERLQGLWQDFQQGQQQGPGGAQWLALLSSWTASQQRLIDESTALWRKALGQQDTELPRQDRRFADPKWREQPLYAVLHQTYLMLAEQVLGAVDKLAGLEPEKHEQLRFAARTLVEALSPDHFPLTNPLVIDRAIETKGESLVKGMEHLIADLGRGQLTHTDPEAFRLGENIAVTPGKVIHESRLFQLIQYTPTTAKVLAVPLVIFPPWINRFYILDLNPGKSFVRWAAEQGITTFMVSWKSADASMADVTWDDYVRAQIEAIDTIRGRLEVPAVHAIGYCVAGTTLAATLAVLARRGEGHKVKSATYFTAQVDFEKAGELKHFIDDSQIATLASLSPEGFLDGRYMAATFNLLRGNDLIWNYVVNHYLLGQDYPAFDLLHWNGDTTNLPAKWHQAYLKDLYRDNRLVIPDNLSADGTPIDLRRIEIPSFVQAGREDHIAPPESVWRSTGHFGGPVHFVLAGSGHIAGVVNPPGANKYQYWTNDGPAETLEDFVAGATEHPGSWWPHWLDWLRGQDDAMVPATGKRVPGGKNDPVIEDAPGRYVRMR